MSSQGYPPGGGDSAERRNATHSFETGDFAAAARQLVSLLARTPPDPILLRLCGMALVRTGAVTQGLPYLARARRLAPREPVAALWHGISLHTAGRFAEALAALEAAALLSPQDPAPLIHRSRALLKLARPLDAAAVARKAADLAPALLEAQQALAMAELAVLTAQPAGDTDPAVLAEAWLALGVICARLDRVQEARSAMQQALLVQPGHAAAGANLAMMEHLCGEPLTAIARLRDVLANDPGCMIARIHLASRLTLDGDAAGALALLDQSPLLDDSAPDAPLRPHWQAHRIDALVQLGRHHEAADELARVQGPVGDAEILLRWQQFRLAREQGDAKAAAASARHVAELAGMREAGGLEHRIHVQFGLANLHHSGNRPEQAFQHWQQGHALLRQAQPFSRTDHAAMIDVIIRAYDPDRVANGPRSDNADPAPVFIVGLPRTGTTLMEQILSAHPMVHGAGERLAIRETLQRLTAASGVAGIIENAAALDSSTLTDAAAAYLADLHALGPGAAIILDKMPDNFFYLGFIATMLPGARIICCTRDLRDVGASIFQHRFLGYHPYAHDLADLGWSMAQHERLLVHWNRTLNRQMLIVDHSDWLDDFDATLHRVLVFLGLPYDVGCTRFFEQDRAVDTASRHQVKQPINKRSVGRWISYATQLAPMLQELPSFKSSRP